MGNGLGSQGWKARPTADGGGGGVGVGVKFAGGSLAVSKIGMAIRL